MQKITVFLILTTHTAVLSDSDSNPTQYSDLDTIIGGKPTTTNNVTTSKWLARTDVGGKIWYGVSWTMTFVLSSQTSNQTDYLLFDAKNSNFNDSNSSQTRTKTAPGFRIALMTANKYLVVGGDTTKTHVNSTSATGSFEDGNYVQIGTGDEKLSDNASGLATNKFNFGTISSTNSVSITCVAWYEGTDPNVVSRYESESSTHTYADTIMSSITSSLVFYTRYVTTTA